MSIVNSVRLLRIPTRHAEVALDPTSTMDDAGDAEYRTALDRVDEIRGEFLRGEFRSVLLEGPFGTGKTRCACRLLLSALDGIVGGFTFLESPVFVRAREACDVRFEKVDEEDPSDRASLRARLFKARVLVLDDLGRLAGYKGEEDFLESVVEHRYDERLPTVVTTSSTDFGNPRIKDFLRTYEVVTFAARSRRA